MMLEMLYTEEERDIDMTDWSDGYEAFIGND